MPVDFFYADENSQPVGPLSLEEIRRFADAGVVPQDVMVCEAGGEDWRPLTGFTSLPRTAPPPKSTTETDANKKLQGPALMANRLHLLLSHAIVAVIHLHLLNSL